MLWCNSTRTCIHSAIIKIERGILSVHLRGREREYPLYTNMTISTSPSVSQTWLTSCVTTLTRRDWSPSVSLEERMPLTHSSTRCTRRSSCTSMVWPSQVSCASSLMPVCCTPGPSTPLLWVELCVCVTAEHVMSIALCVEVCVTLATSCFCCSLLGPVVWHCRSICRHI